MKNQKEKGNLYEQIAHNYLEKENFRILERNWRASRKSEIDLICIKNNTLIFVEVKGRSSEIFGREDAFHAISQLKLKRILWGINFYLQSIERAKKKLVFKNYQLDLIFIWGTKNKIEHIKNLDFL